MLEKPVDALSRRSPGALLLALWVSTAGAVAAPQQRACVLITGLGGMPEYEENFQQWGDRLQGLFSERLQATVYRLDGRRERKSRIQEVFESVTGAGFEEVWLFLVGHATHDGRNYKFNILGPDLTDSDLSLFLDGLGEARTYLVAATSAGGTLAEMGAPNRSIITATRSARERQPPLFLSFFLESVDSEGADRDKDGRTSLLEAFYFTRQRVSEWYEEKGRLQTEHSLLDDRGQVRLTAREEEDPDQTGLLLASMAYLTEAEQQIYNSPQARALAAEKTRLEREIEDLKFQKSRIGEDVYYRSLEKLLVELAHLNQKIAGLEGNP